MPSVRAAAEIEPVERIASKSAIFPGPMRAPEARSMRIVRFVPAMDCHPADASRGHADMGASSRDLFGSLPAAAPKINAAAEAAASLAQMTYLIGKALARWRSFATPPK